MDLLLKEQKSEDSRLKLSFEIEYDRLNIKYETKFSNHQYNFDYLGEILSLKKLKAFSYMLKNLDKIDRDTRTYMIIDDDINDHDLSNFDGMATFLGVNQEKNAFHIYYWDHPHASFETFIDLDKCKKCFIELFDKLIDIYEKGFLDEEIKKEYILGI